MFGQQWAVLREHVLYRTESPNTGKKKDAVKTKRGAKKHHSFFGKHIHFSRRLLEVGSWHKGLTQIMETSKGISDLWGDI